MAKILTQKIRRPETRRVRELKVSFEKLKPFVIGGFALFVLGFIVTAISDVNKRKIIPGTSSVSEQESVIRTILPKGSNLPTPAKTDAEKYVEAAEALKARKDDLQKNSEKIGDSNDLSLNTRGDGYSIIYFPEGDYFNISIIASPFDIVREAAELDFVEIMKMEKEMLCNLNVVVTTPRFANPNEAGKTYGLSFCE